MESAILSETQSENSVTSIEPAKPVEIWTLCLTAMMILGGVLKFFVMDLPAGQLDQRLKKTAAEKAESEIVTIRGHWHPPEGFTKINGMWISVSPVFIEIRNHGEIPVEVKKIEFRVLTAPLEDVVVLNGYSLEKLKADLAAGPKEEKNTEGDRSPVMGFVNPESEKWKEQSFLELSKVDGTIPPGQQKTERRHVIIEQNSLEVLTKVEVTVITSNGEYRWYGFSPTSPVVCTPEPFLGGFSSAEDAPAPPAAPAAPME